MLKEWTNVSPVTSECMWNQYRENVKGGGGGVTLLLFISLDLSMKYESFSYSGLMC